MDKIELGSHAKMIISNKAYDLIFDKVKEKYKLAFNVLSISNFDKEVIPLVYLAIYLDVFSQEVTIDKNDTILFGRESAGAPEFVHEIADARLKIPISKNTRSLNVVNSISIVLSEALRQNNYYNI